MTDAPDPEIADLQARLDALDPARSFIVQAPAGSGKTELLIQRYLVLLSRVEQPEEIAAITFTRKAAAEMRKRVLEALAFAESDGQAADAQQALTREHARAALRRSRALGWQLQQNAARLRIQTIDALCLSLTRQMPVLARFGAQPESIEDAAPLYAEAAQATLALLEERGEASDDVARLLSHLDNDVGTAAGLLADMLRRRDHWLRNLHGARNREALEAALAALRLEAVARVQALLPPEADAMLGFPAGKDVDAWQAIAKQLLTKKGTWRERSALAQSLAQYEALRAALAELALLPPARYTDTQWEALGAIARLLPLAVANLKLLFAARGQADFVEIAQGALAALGEEDAPTDLLLSLDYRIRHILVDEFQDTSFSQFDLLARLTAGWQQDEARTLFVVGDPMQSIYRFRQAEVGLFLRARSDGIGPVLMEPLTLSVNFRSQADIVDWVNAAFARIMPGEENIASGAVPYSPSDALHPAEAEAVRVHAFFNRDAEGEAAKVAEIVTAAQGEQGRIAVLVRNRSHLGLIVPQLKQRGLRFRAIEIEELGRRQVVQDLLALTRALAHPADRTAWLACLRAPWCGLTLADLLALCSSASRPYILEDSIDEIGSDRASADRSITNTDTKTLWELILDPATPARLSPDGGMRIARLRTAFAPVIANRLRGSLRDRVEDLWLALDGPACVEDDTGMEDAAVYLDLLEQLERAGEIADLSALEQGVTKLFALPDLHADDTLQVMTIHKAKGLEFDTVIVPGLGRSTRPRDSRLFLWMERSTMPGPDMTAGAYGGPGRQSEQVQLLLAPIRQTGAERDPIYDCLVRLERDKEDHEEGRLLYVAATRAKTHLHLIGDTRLVAIGDDVEMKPPKPGSLLAKLWPAVESDFAEAARQTPPDDAAAHATYPGAAGEDATVDQDLRRLPSDWMHPEAPSGVVWPAPPPAVQAGGEIEFSWAGETARHVGSVVHRWLQRIAEDRMQGWNRARVASMGDAFHRELSARGVGHEELDASVARVGRALCSSLDDERGRWLLGPHPETASEHRIKAVADGEVRLLVIDRLLRDSSGGRWIVDFKTSSHEGAGVEAFLDRERERYRPQLERYRAALASPDPVRLGLYFPLLGGWREWV